MTDINKQGLQGLFGGGDLWIWLIVLFLIFGVFNDSPFFGLGTEKNS